MYIPDHFSVHHQNDIEAFISENRFGVFIFCQNNNFEASHLPFTYTKVDHQYALEFHIARENPLAKMIQNDTSALFVIQGAHGYITSSVYHHANVPTYNYEAVHLHGKIKLMDENELKHHLESLTNEFEKQNQTKLELGQLPKELLTNYFKEIIGFKLHAQKIEASFKLSQNRNKADFDEILNDLSRNPNHQALIKAMKSKRQND